MDRVTQPATCERAVATYECREREGGEAKDTVLCIMVDQVQVNTTLLAWSSWATGLHTSPSGIIRAVVTIKEVIELKS